MRKISVCFITLCLIMGIAVSVYGEDSASRGQVTTLFGDEGYASAKYNLTDQFSITGVYEDELFKAGLYYQPSDRIGLKAGEVYNHNTEHSYPYGGIDFLAPFGNNLKIAGLYDLNYKGEDWDRYEVALRIQMFENHFIYAGVRGDLGDGAPALKYNSEDRDAPQLFMRGDFSWHWKRVDLNLKPMLYVKGYYYHDYTLKYHFNDKTSMVLSINNYDDSEMNYRTGLEIKF